MNTGTSTMSMHSTPLPHATDSLDLGQLEAESRALLLQGFFLGTLFLAGVSFFVPEMDRPRKNTAMEGVRPVTLVRIYTQKRKPPPSGRMRITDRSERVSPDAALSDTSSTPVNSDAAADSFPASRLALRNAIPVSADSSRNFPNLADNARTGPLSAEAIAGREREMRQLVREYAPRPDSGKGNLDQNFSIGEKGHLLITHGAGLLIFDLFPLEEKPVEDERRRYRKDLFGLPVGRGITIGITPGYIGGNALGLVNTGRHLAKTIAWKMEDAKKARELAKMQKDEFRTITGRELRFLILMWRDTRLDSGRLSRRDRAFIARDGQTTARSYRESLSVMENHGLIVSLQVDGRLRYRAKCSREEILQALVYRFESLENGQERETVRKYIALIMQCVDLATGQVIIPDDAG